MLLTPSVMKQFSDNPSFKKWLGDSNFAATYNAGAVSQEMGSKFRLKRFRVAKWGL